MKLINLDNGDVLEVYVFALRDRGIPDGYRVADSITVDELIELYCNLLESKK